MPTLEVTRRDGSKHLILFDDIDADIVGQHVWHVRPQGSGIYYAGTNIATASGRKIKLMHILLMGRAGVDHINHNGLDNRRENLRLANQSLNNGNQRPRSGGSSKFKGVCWHKRGQKWQATIAFNSKRRGLGLFESEIDAAKAYDRAAREQWGEFALTNFPEEGI